MTEPIRDSAYLAQEKQLEERMAQVYRDVNEKKKQLRANVDLTDEERQEAFAQWYQPIGQNLQDAASTFVGQWESLRDDLNRQVHQGTGERFADHLTRVSELPNDKLDEVMDVAIRTGQPELEQAVAEVALTRRRTGIFQKFTERHPERGAALKRLHNLPPTDRVITRATARASVPNATFDGLTPTEEDRERAATHRRMAEAERERALRAPKITRRVGRTVTEVPQL
jgi:hypothetical protein